MKYNKILKFIVCFLLSALSFTELQQCSQAPQNTTASVILQPKKSKSAQKRHRKKLRCIEQQEKKSQESIDAINKDINLIKDQLLETWFFDSKVVDYWTSGCILSLIKANVKPLGLSESQIIFHVVACDDWLQKNKDKMKEQFLEDASRRIANNNNLNPFLKMNLLIDLQVNAAAEQDRYWLEYLYAEKDSIHRSTQVTKIKNCHAAWPFIKEIHKIRNFSTVYTNQKGK